MSTSKSNLLNEMASLTLPLIHQQTKTNKDTHIIKLENKIGKGGYGTVFSCRDEQGSIMAVKCIATSKEGIPCLMEASIMSVIHHPYLNSAIKICADPTMLYIVQMIAISDIRKYLTGNIVGHSQLVGWTQELLQAVGCLHKHDLIHGDIKAANVLIYADGHIKLSDFTLTTMASWPNRYKPCTGTHRPLEVWLSNGGKFTKAVDIWALGCTIFELLYSRSLFSNQERDPSINALIDWALLGPIKQNLNLTKRPDFYHSFSLPASFDPTTNLNKLFLSMLIIDVDERPPITQLLNGFIIEPTTIIDSPTTNTIKENKSKRTKLDKQLDKMTADLEVKNLGYELYMRCTAVNNLSDALKLNTCVWIAHKLILRSLIPRHELKFPFHEILQTERLICHHLNFRLHSTGSQCVVIR